jgi:4-hydroxy-tetrahydrodipicolinate synthase
MMLRGTRYRCSMSFPRLIGVYAAAVTPLKPDYSLDLEGIPVLLDFLAKRGCHGALLLGTTGEGPSFAPEERLAVMRIAAQVRQSHPDFRLLAGTGTPSLTETLALTKAAFDLNMDGVVVLPPYYFRKVTDEGLFTWFAQVLRQAVPEGGALFGYHIPPVTGVPFSLDLLKRLKDAFPTRFAGIKDSSGDASFARQLGERFGHELVVLTGNDRLFSLALESSAAGCITAMANVISPLLRSAWDACKNGQPASSIQQQLNLARDVMERYPPAPPLLKALLARKYGLPAWAVRPPLVPIPPDSLQQAVKELEEAMRHDG